MKDFAQQRCDSFFEKLGKNFTPIFSNSQKSGSNSCRNKISKYASPRKQLYDTVMRALLREYVETYRETSENEYPVSMLDVLRPLSKHSFVSYLATYGQTRRADHLPSRHRGRSWQNHEAGDPSFFDCQMPRVSTIHTDVFDAYLYRIIINICAVKQFL